MKRPRDISSHNASRTYERKRWVTITFRDSPFFSEKGRLLKMTLGRHCDLCLELPNGKRITIDACWTNYEEGTRPQSAAHRIDLMQIQPIVGLIEYLNNKLNDGLPQGNRT